MKRIILFVGLIVGAAGCQQLSTPSAQRAEYTTIASIDSAAQAAVSGYYALVIKGVVPTNGVPEVAKRYAQIQMSAILAANLAQNGTNALAPTELQQEFTDLSNIVNALTTH